MSFKIPKLEVKIPVTGYFSQSRGLAAVKFNLNQKNYFWLQLKFFCICSQK